MCTMKCAENVENGKSESDFSFFQTHQCKRWTYIYSMHKEILLNWYLLTNPQSTNKEHLNSLECLSLNQHKVLAMVL